MTSTQDDLTVIRPLITLFLTVRDPSGRVRRVPLAPGVLTIGRDEMSGLPLEPDDTSASRRHAGLSVDGTTVTVTDLGSTNGVFVNGVRVEQAVLAPGDELRLGHAVLVIESGPQPDSAPGIAPASAPKASGRRRGRSKTRLLLLLVLLAGLLFLLGLGICSKREAPQPALSESGKEEPAAASSTDALGASAAQAPAPGPETVEKANDFFRQGMFFYNNKQLALAIGEWEKAMALDPRNAHTAKWLARAESERDQLLDKYYREGVTALKYARLDEAKTAFRFVLEHCRSQAADERCQDAVKQMVQLEGSIP